MGNILKRIGAVALGIVITMGFVPLMGGAAYANAPTVEPAANVKAESAYSYGKWGMQVTWDKSPTAGARYSVYRGPYTASAESDYTKLGTVSSNKYFDTTAQHDQKYKYAVVADDSFEHYSTMAVSPVVTADYRPKDKPDIVSAKVDGTTVTLNWAGNGTKVQVSQVKSTGLSYVPEKHYVDGTLETTYKITGLESNTTYTFGVRYINEYGEGQYAVFQPVTTGEASGGGSGSEDPGTGTTAHIVSGPKISTVYTSTTLLKKTVTVNVTGGALEYYMDDPASTKSIYYVTVRLSRNGKVIATRENYYVDGGSCVFENVPVSYGSKDTFKVQLFATIEGTEVPGASYTYEDQSAKIGKTSVSATKISAGKVGLRWSAVAGATGYKVFAGGKLIKTLGNKTTFTYSKKKAASKKYQVAPIIKTGGKTYAGSKSAAVKAKANTRTYPGSKNYKSVKYGIAPYSITKIELKGNTYVITGYALNNRIFKLKKYQKLDITIYCNGKKVAHKKWKNLKVNCKASGSKKLVLKIKGKGGVDFRNAVGTTYSASWTPYWASVGAKPF